MKTKIYDDVYDAVLADYDAGLRMEKVAVKYGVSSASAYRIIRAEAAALNGDLDALRRMQKFSERVVDIACRKHGISLRGEVRNEVAVPPVDNIAHVVGRVLELLEELAQSSRDTAVALQGISTELSALRMAVAGTRKDMNERMDKVVEAVNVNGDIITKEHDKMIDLLGAVKMNTKKAAPGAAGQRLRGGNHGAENHHHRRARHRGAEAAGAAGIFGEGAEGVLPWLEVSAGVPGWSACDDHHNPFGAMRKLGRNERPDIYGFSAAELEEIRRADKRPYAKREIQTEESPDEVVTAYNNWRKAHRYTQVDAALHFGVSQWAVRKWVNRCQFPPRVVEELMKEGYLGDLE